MRHNVNFIKIFLEDIAGKITALEKINKKQTIDNNEEMGKTIYYTHACVGILSCFGEMELSNRASMLESLLRTKKTSEYFKDLCTWLFDVKNLMTEMEDNINNLDKLVIDFDFEHLKTQAILIKETCKNNDFEKAYELVSDLNKMPWPDDIKKILLKAYTHVISGDLDDLYNALCSLD